MRSTSGNTHSGTSQTKATKSYVAVTKYEDKLKRVMSRLGVNKYNYDYGRFDCWVEFEYKGQVYRFEHSIEQANRHNQHIEQGRDAFAQVVLALEDLTRMVERGIYDLSTWISGMKYLPPAKPIPQCFYILGLNKIPTEDELKNQYRKMVKLHHPDVGGSTEQMILINEAFESAKTYLSENRDKSDIENKKKSSLTIKNSIYIELHLKRDAKRCSSRLFFYQI